ncbi:MAG: DNA mismatch repair endonuclease MutL [Candidatus Cloacimonetes bacterium]|nr:DNA mismatch repair endonuclease MutL [Candidatus Cloacimonadota bacterium]
MGKIKILAEEVANRIAAGEVIERPASVVKELVENSIDAEATSIIVSIEQGGKKLIQTVDNGIGMSEDDALQCFERHATSKIRTVEDIFQIHSLGFRGEALPSIASVSQLTLITKDKNSDLASQIEFNSGRLTDFTKTSANQGTTIIVRNLFRNVPARKKFLKSDQVEFKHILNYLHYQSVLYPQIHFRLIVNGSEKLNYPVVSDRETRMLAIFGRNFLQKDLLKLDSGDRLPRLSGFLGGLEDEAESFLDYRYLYVNGRFIRDKVIMHSIRSAYDPFLKKNRKFQSGKLPPFILFLLVSPDQVDFNVHPAKMELRFTDPGAIHNFVKRNITERLLTYEENKFASARQKFAATLQEERPTSLEQAIYRKKSERHFSSYKKEFEKLNQPDLFNQPDPDELDQSQKNINRDLFLKAEEDVINPWQLHQSYIFVQIQEGLLIIDQHAAHERIIYEKILHRIHGAPAQTQRLLFPLVIDLPPYLNNIIPQLISENLEILNKIGFSIKTFSGDSIVIDEIPVEIENWDGGEVFIEILKKLEEEFSQTEDFRDSMSKSIACKAAVKAGRKMTRKEMLTLINDLFACEVPYYCPHGRPLIIKMTLTEFEKKFKRIE